MAPGIVRPKRSEGFKEAFPVNNNDITGSRGRWKTANYYFKHIVVPTLFIGMFPFLGILLAVYAQDGTLRNFHLSYFLGNKFTWTTISLLITWAWISQKVTSKVYHGPATNFGYTPKYSANGFTYYWMTIGAFLTINFVSSKSSALSTRIVRDMPLLLGNLVTVAFILCLYLWYKGRRQLQVRMEDRRPMVFEFYRGMELHPRIFDVDVKQLTNSRIGLILWQILIIAFLLAGYQRNGGFNAGHTVNVLLQSIYLAKFYWWETGYFNTLDITLDRAGFYICWGCLAFVPIGYTYSSYYFVYHPPTISATTALFLFIIGVVFIYLNYEVDRQKEVFRKTDGKCKINGRQVTFMEVKYKSNVNGGVTKSKLLLSGFWGTARHLNYVFELIAALVWNLTGWGLGPMPFLYNIYLVILLTHRVFRDENKCQEKYGTTDWNKYCKAVPYRLVPYIF